jgi:serine/threonine protein kinase
MSTLESCPQCGTKLDADRPQGLCPACLLRQAMNSQVTAAVPESRESGLPFVPPTPQELSPFFTQLEIFELIGRGGMGAVYRARQRSLDRIVALKVLPPGVSRDPSFEERFTREARALARVNHPNIVNVYEFGQSAGGLFYFVMEFVDGVNLRQMIQTHQLAPAEALAIVPQICDALQYAHDEGIVHRDIKPESILVDRKGRVKIADFGLAKILSPKATDYTLTSPQMVMGTPHYMAPEQLEKPATVDHRADIYSLGVVFYEMLTGELPLSRFEPPSHKITLDIRLDDVVLKTLEKEPQRRYQRVGMVKTDLATIASRHAPAHEAVAGANEPAPPATQISTRQRWILLLCALALPSFFLVLPRVLGRPIEMGYATGVGAVLLFVTGSVWESLPQSGRSHV